MSIDGHELDAVMDDVLEAVLLPDKWASVLQRICEATGADGLVILPVTGRAPGVPATDSLGEGIEEYFADGWNEKDFRMRSLPFVMEKGSAIEHDFASEDELNHHSYYKFFAKHGFRWSAILGFGSDDDLLYFVLQRRIKSGYFDRKEEALLRRIRGRLTLSSQIMRSMSSGRVDGIAEAFDMMDLGCLFFDRRGMVTKVNDAGQALIGHGIQIVRGDLSARTTTATATLRRHIRAATSGLLLEEADAGSPILLPRETGRPLTARVQRLKGSLADIFTHSVGIVIVADPDARAKPRIDILRGLYGLTLREAEIALLIAEGRSLQDIAADLAITYETVRTYVKTLFSKTGTQRQSEVAAMVSQLRFP